MQIVQSFTSRPVKVLGRRTYCFRTVNIGTDLGKEKFCQDAGVLVLAHRGAHDPETPGVRENTLEAFRAASIVDGVELDVRRSADGVLVVHHDRALQDGRTIAEVAAEGLPDWIPTLDAALAACAGMALVNVEIKAEPGFHPELTRQVADALTPNSFVSSFNLVALDAFHAEAPSVPTGWLTMPGYDQADAVAAAAAAGHRALNPPDAST
ncbi:MAG: glycerophosphodiester phosphodiesterase, partial [Acidimicrobiales bacterium]